MAIWLNGTHQEEVEAPEIWVAKIGHQGAAPRALAIGVAVEAVAELRAVVTERGELGVPAGNSSTRYTSEGRQTTVGAQTEAMVGSASTSYTTSVVLAALVPAIWAVELGALQASIRLLQLQTLGA